MNIFNHENLQVKYRIDSILGPMENDRFNQRIQGKIELINKDGEKVETIGYTSVNRLLMERGFNVGYGPLEIYDATDHLMQVGLALFDFVNGDWKPTLEKHYPGDLEGSNILILSRLELIPKYRGRGFGPYLIRDIYNNFIDGMALFVVEVFPLQFEAGILESANKFAKSMKYDKMEKNLERATSKVISFYEKIGFEMVPSVTKDFMFINPSLINKKFDQVMLE